MRVENEPAYVLHSRPWRETSRLVEVLTRDHGRVGLVARGLDGPRRHAQRAALQPLQSVRLDYLPRGELARLLQVEALDAAPRLAGDRLLAGFYVNELVLRLCPRNAPQERAWALYGRLRADLAQEPSLAWTLRRFERDLLDALGVGLPWAWLDSGDAVDPAARYRLDPEHGPIADPRGVPGSALQALADDREPAPADLAALRSALRGVLATHLGPVGLKSWGLVGQIAAVRARDD